MVQRAHFHSFGKIDCWLTFSRLPGEQIYYEYNCPSSKFYVNHLRDVEIQFSRICRHFVKYRNTPHRDASTSRYFPDYRDLMRTKRKWDPHFLLGPETLALRDLSIAA
eukprot:TRINITY_DN102093_c0_g1_i1.p1 TRINITY_DN102093_c0_g1~~TRINITY_DN102093_c0_g1_i1.p1  ORF type:complete len:120 (-),score=13.97 TRINITY_DN102093_c0_g1_i1:26-349(-)